jgi:O-antigen ligase
VPCPFHFIESESILALNRLGIFFKESLPLWWIGLVPIGTVNFQHMYPVHTFIEEWFAAGCLCAAALHLLIMRRNAAREIPAVVLVPIALIALIIAQAAFGQFPDKSRATYLLLLPLLMMISVWTGRSLAREFHAPRVLHAIFAGLMGASFLQLVLQLLQLSSMTSVWPWLMNPALGTDVAHGNIRAFGHLGQPNLLATLHCLGLAGLAWFYRSGAVRLRLAVAALLMMVMGIVLTGSRIGALEFVLGIAFVALCTPEPGTNITDKLREMLVMAVFAGLAYFVTLGLVHGLDLAVNTMDNRGANAAASNSFRVTNWIVATRVWLSAPLFGVGLNSLGWAEISFLDGIDRLEGGINAHNLVLHLLAEAGLAGAALVLVPLIAALWRLVLAARTRQEFGFVLLAVLLLLSHSMVEFPYLYAYLLIPVCLLWGAGETRQFALGHMPLARLVLTGIIVLALPLCVFSMFDFLRASDLGMPTEEDLQGTTPRTTVTNASDASSGVELQARRNFQTELREAGKSVLFPYVADRVMLLLLDTGPGDIDSKLTSNERNMRQGISPSSAFLQGIWLAQAGRPDDALAFLKRYQKFVNGDARSVTQQVYHSAQQYPDLEKFREAMESEFPYLLEKAH